MNSNKLLVIIGMGKGISYGVARKFGKEGFKVVLVSRNITNLKKYQSELSKEGIDSFPYIATAGEPNSVKQAIKKIENDHGTVDVLLYNASKIKKTHILSDTSLSIADDFKINVGGALTATKAVLPGMLEKGSGSIFFTGGGFALKPNPDFGSLGLGKAALRNLNEVLNESLKETPIHVASVIVTGKVSESDKKYSPNAIAEEYWKLYEQPVGKFDSEIIY